ncbi:anion permease [Candidatus Dependentiae bacterium]|nr:anion permease [Candidatus Dependentiae bacterium]
MISLLKILNWKLFGGLFLGWGVGANDSANVFGTAVATNSIKFKTAVTLIAIFVILGSCIHGTHLFEELNFKHTSQNENSEQQTSQSPSEKQNEKSSNNETKAFISTLAAALTVLVATILGIPASTSQAAIGAMLGMAISDALALGGPINWATVADWTKFGKMLVCWVLNPIGTAIISIVLYYIVGFIIKLFYGKDLSGLNRLYRILLLLAGSYGAYELGANNVVITTAPYYNSGMFGDISANAVHVWWKEPALIAAFIGSLSIAIGALTYSKKVMYTVGSSITALDPFSAMITVFSHSLSLMVFTMLKVPVSSSQAIVGAVMGIGLIRGGNTIRYKTLGFIFIGWVMTPVLGATIAYILYKFAL